MQRTTTHLDNAPSDFGDFEVSGPETTPAELDDYKAREAFYWSPAECKKRTKERLQRQLKELMEELGAQADSNFGEFL